MRVVLIIALAGATSAQTCAAGGSTGPCVNLMCESGSSCIASSNLCCYTSSIIQPGTTAAPCVDLVNPNTGISDCPKMVSYCNNTIYYDLMTQQCPKTCGRCGSAGSGTTAAPASTCVDKVNPQTGVSDCPQKKAYCDNAVYYTLMTEQCPKTCGRC